MGLRDEITTEVGAAFDGDLADAVGVVDLIMFDEDIGQIYDPDTGDVLQNEDTYSSRGVMSPVSTSHIDGEVVLISDVEVLVLQAELSATPRVGAFIESGGTRYVINVVTADPAGVSWTMIVRKV